VKPPRPGEITDLGKPEFIGAFPVWCELEVLRTPKEDEIGAKEWAEHGNCAVYVFNGGPLDHRWTLAVGGAVLIRSTHGGWFMTELRKNSRGWYVHVQGETVPIVWSEKRQVWVSTEEV
jgi:hypothetical protein